MGFFENVKSSTGRAVRRALQKAGYGLVRLDASPGPSYPVDFDADAVALIEQVASYTLTSPERIVALREAVRYVVRTGVPGSFVECGVWRGGSAIVMLQTLVDLGATDRDVFLFDTYEAMPPPGDEDLSADGVPVSSIFEEAAAAPAFRYLPFDDVKAAVLRTGYPPDRVRFVAGMVEDTIPARAPERIALCRLDTDWYVSTAHELAHLYPRIAPGGVLLIDDYGHFLGARKAVDEYLAQHDLPLLLHRIDYSGRIAVVPRR